jgi:HTH-type transcriptional regulator/antitoxin HipB
MDVEYCGGHDRLLLSARTREKPRPDGIRRGGRTDGLHPEGACKAKDGKAVAGRTDLPPEGPSEKDEASRRRQHVRRPDRFARSERPDPSDTQAVPGQLIYTLKRILPIYTVSSIFPLQEGNAVVSVVRIPSQMGAAIRRQRKLMGLSQTQLGEKTNLRQATISELEGGKGGIQLKTLTDVLAALDLELIVQSRSKAAVEVEDLF